MLSKYTILFLSQDHDEQLRQLASHLAATSQRCETLGGGAGSGADSELYARAEKTQTRLTKALLAVEEVSARLQDTIQGWETAERLSTDLTSWVRARQTELKDLSDRPAKLHTEAAQIELQQLQVSCSLHCNHV